MSIPYMSYPHTHLRKRVEDGFMISPSLDLHLGLPWQHEASGLGGLPALDLWLRSQWAKKILKIKIEIKLGLEVVVAGLAA